MTEEDSKPWIKGLDLNHLKTIKVLPSFKFRCWKSNHDPQQTQTTEIKRLKQTHPLQQYKQSSVSISLSVTAYFTTGAAAHRRGE